MKYIFLAEASSKHFAYYYPWQTCYIHHLLNSLGGIHSLYVSSCYLDKIIRHKCMM